MEILPRINSPQDIKGLTLKELHLLAEDIRHFILEQVNQTGGHLASNLGVVELTLALHRVFDSPRDKLIWDVGHQCYPHKILTGRKNSFDKLRQKGGISGFPRRSESPHDAMDAGHSSTSLSAALGMLTGQELRGEKGYVIPVIGDGALTGGMAWEALSHIGHLGKPVIIILNDNDMSINPNVGAFSSYLSRLTAKGGYQRFRRRADKGMLMLPLFGKTFYRAVHRVKRSVKALFYKETLFSDLGLQYVGPVDGHNINRMIHLFEDLKEIEKPVVVHLITRKGKGYRTAEDDPASFHGVSPAAVTSSAAQEERVGEMTTETQPQASVPAQSGGGTPDSPFLPTFTQAFSQAVVATGEKHDEVVAVTAAMTSGTGLTEFARRWPKRFFDVSISEQHGVTFAAGMAAAGARPVVAIYSTFMQRAVDQVIHDVAIPSLPVTFCLDRGGLVPGDGETHQGVFDIPLYRSVPHLKILAPATQEEMNMMLEYAQTQKGPVMLRYAKDRVLPETGGSAEALQEGEGVFLRKNQGDILLVSMGALGREALRAAEILAREGVSADVYNLRFIKPLNQESLARVFSLYSTVVFLEDGARSGGLGESLMAMVDERRLDVEYHHLGVPDRFMGAMNRDELLEECGLKGESLVDWVRELLREQRIQGVVRMFREKGLRKNSM